MVGRLNFAENALNIVYRLCALLLEHRQKSSHYACNDKGIVGCAVVVEIGQAQPV